MKLTLENFKGFKEASLDLDRPLTLLVGPNGSGKSNLIEAIELGGFLASGRMLNEVGEIGSGAALEVRGGLSGCARNESGFVGLGARVEVSIGSARVEASWAISLRTGNATVKDEELELLGEFHLPNRKSVVKERSLVFRTLPGQRPNEVAIKAQLNNFDRGLNLPERPASPLRSLLSQYGELTAGMKHREPLVSAVEEVRASIRRPLVLDPLPRAMRQYERMGNRALLRSGANLSSVLYGLHKDENGGRETLARLESVVRDFPDEGFDGIGFVETSLHDVIFGLRRTGGGRLIDAKVLSDGTLRILAILAALETADAGGVIVVEEFDNGVHPSRAARLVRAMAEACRRRSLRVLVTTHNPATLDALEPPELEGVAICHWSEESQAYRLTALNDVPRSLELMERGRLGDLVTRRIVDRYLAPGFEEARRAEVAKWLEALP